MLFFDDATPQGFGSFLNWLVLPLVCVVALYSTRDASADVVLFDSGVDLPDYAYTSDIGSSSQFIADDFTLTADSRLTRLQWSGSYINGPTQDFFEIWLMRDVDADPDSYLLRPFLKLQPTSVSRIDTGINFTSNLNLFAYEADVSSANAIVNGNERLFISIFNETASSWVWGTDTRFGEMYYASDSTGGTINPFQSTMDFSLSGQHAVPEPAAYLVLAALGLLVFAKRACKLATRRRAS